MNYKLPKLILFIIFVGTPLNSFTQKIAILGYGSLIGRPGELEIKTDFKKTPFSLPINLTKKTPRSNKLVVTLDNQYGLTMPVWYAISKHTVLDDALKNLAQREGSQGTANTAYMKKQFNEQPKNPYEKSIPTMKPWYIKQDISSVMLSNQKAQEIAQWAHKNNIDAVIWAAYPPNIAPDQADQELNNHNTLQNTRGYLKQVPRETLEILRNHYSL